ncbi:MAG: oligosaccharide flippase family protein, partial [Nitrososphaerota archaeon]|nr:oligosaccharide flippase family protein [Nitrososphaerota archaeon]
EVGLALLFTVVFFGLSGLLASKVLGRPQLGGAILPVAMLSVIGQAAYTVTTSGLVGLGKYEHAAVFQVAQGATRLVVSVGLILLGLGVMGAVAGYTIAFFVSGLLGVGMVAGMSGKGLPPGLKADLTTGVTYAWPVYLSILASGFVAPAINTTLALTVSNSQIGAYALAATFSSLIALFTYPITTALFPLFSRKSSDPSVQAKTYETSVWFTGLLVLPVTAFIIAFSGPLMVTFYGKAYSFGSNYLALLAAISLFAGLGSLAWSALLSGVGHTRDVLVVTALGSAVSVALAVILIQFMGVSGAIVGQIIGTGVQLALGTWMVARRLGTRLKLGPVWKLYVSAAVAAVITYPISFLIKTPEISFVAGAVVYVLLFIPLLALLKTMSKEGMASLRSYLGFSPAVSRPLEYVIRYYYLVARTHEAWRSEQSS